MMFIEIKNRHRPCVTTEVRRRILIDNLDDETLEMLRYADQAWANSEGAVVILNHDGGLRRAQSKLARS